jgi:DNA processing protein
MDEDRIFYLAFSLINGIGPVRFKLLLEYFGSAKKAWEAPENELEKIGLNQKIVDEIIGKRRLFKPETYITDLAKKEISFITASDKDYPELLKQISDPPFVLFVKGKIIKEDILAVGIVGTRYPSMYGREVTERISSDLAISGVTVVSGMARGIDTIAHHAALEAGGRTIAVLGCGIDIIYPPENRQLYYDITKNGAVVSEFPPGMLVSRGLFPARNRLISGLSKGIVVTEGAKESGSLITASYAAKQGRDVFAIPGSITNPMSVAPISLMKDGAKIVTSAKDILDEFGIMYGTLNSHEGNNRKGMKATSPIEQAIFSILAGGGIHIDQLIRKLEKKPEDVLPTITLMEIQGKIKNSGNMTYYLNI